MSTHRCPHIGLEGLRCPGASPEGSLAQSPTCNLRLAGFSLLPQRGSSGSKVPVGKSQEPAGRPRMVLTSHLLTWPPPSNCRGSPRLLGGGEDKGRQSSGHQKPQQIAAPLSITLWQGKLPQVLRAEELSLLPTSVNPTGRS